MTLTVPPDVQALLSGFLADQPEVADLAAGGVRTERPPDATFPLVLLTLVGGTPKLGDRLWVEESLIQVDSWAGSKPEALALAQTCRAAIAERLPGVHDNAVVSGVRFGSLRDLPDPDEAFPNRHRYTFDVTITSHP